MNALISILVFLVIFAIIFGFVYYIVTLLPLPAPFKNIALIAVLLIGLLILIGKLLALSGHAGYAF